MDFYIKADNPKGLNYDEVRHDGMSAQIAVKRIAFLGGTNITVNGQPIPMELIAALRVA